MSEDQQKQEDSAKLKQARPYQSLLIEHAIQENSIIYLPTGSGKTFIAIKVIQHYGKDLEKTIKQGGKRTVFIVNTNVLAQQQAQVLNSALTYEVGILTGEQNIDGWNKYDWEIHLEKFQILVATTQVILDAVRLNFISISHFNVMVFDECHHARKSHPMHELMKSFDDVDVVVQPRVIGLSGTLIASSIRPDEVEMELQGLESIFKAKIITVNNLKEHENVLVHSTNPKELFIRYKTMNDFEVIVNYETDVNAIASKLECMNLPNTYNLNPKTLRKTLARPIKELVNLFKNFIYELKENGLFGGYLSLLALTIEFELRKLTTDSQVMKDILNYCITEVEWMKKDLSDLIEVDDLTSIKILLKSTQKLRKLISYLEYCFRTNKDLQCIIFVQRRHSAKLLYHILKEYRLCDPSFQVIPDFVVGFTNEIPESIEAIIQRNNNKEALDKFRTHQTNCLISSSVLEEGIDIQSCNLVIMYDPIHTYRTYVQTKGRARHKTSEYVLFVEEQAVRHVTTNKDIYSAIDEKLKKILIEKTIDRLDVDDESIEKERQYNWPPFVTEAGAQLSQTSAISLLHRYANTLPKDLYSNANIGYTRIDNEAGKVKVIITLPSQCSIKQQIEGDFMDDVKTAKQFAAFRACVELYLAGEIDDHLLPIDSKMKIEMYNFEYFAHWDKYDAMADNEKKDAGVSKRRIYKIGLPDEMVDCEPRVGNGCFIYEILVQPNFDATDEPLQVFKNLYQNSTNYGILTTKPIPQLCSMKFFQSYGEVNVRLDHHPHLIQIENQQQLTLMQNFHVMIFRDLLKTWKPFFVFENNSFLIVPLKNNQINWNLMKNFQQLDPPPFCQRLAKKVVPKREEFEYSVVNPYYLAEYCQGQTGNYIVTRVRDDMSPISQLSADPTMTYKDYVESKYKLNVTQLNQFLIEVRGVSKNLNILYPGGGKKGRHMKLERTRKNEIYIPEVVHNYGLSGDYWLKATLLPVTLHRIQYLLHAEKLRNTLLKVVGIGNPNVPQIYELDVDYGSFDQRVEKAKLLNAIHERESGAPRNNQQILNIVNERIQTQLGHHLTEASTSATFLQSSRHCGLVDLDRNWTSAKKTDIENYSKYCQLNSDFKSSPNVSSDRIRIKKKQSYGTPKFIRIIRLDSTGSDTPQQKDLVKILTTTKSDDVFDMERFEVLGDAYLKFITSLFLYKYYPEWHEGYLTTLKGKIVSNRNLFYCGNDFGLPELIKFINFQPRTEWVPPSCGVDLEAMIEDYNKDPNSNKSSNRLTLKGLESENLEKMLQKQLQEHDKLEIDQKHLMYLGKQCFKDKIVADCVEALLGVCVNSVGIVEPIKLLKHLHVLPKDKCMERLLTDKIAPRIFRQCTQESILKMLIHYKKCEEIIGYTFKDRSYLLQAMTHRSYPMNTITGSYQELEFLGDAVLDFLITSYIFEQCPKMDPGNLTDLRSALVNNVTLGCIVVRHDLHKFLLSHNYVLSNAIDEFVEFQKKNNYEITEEIQLLMTDGDQNTAIASSTEVPKVLGDLFESIVGAIYLDSGMNLEVTWTAIHGLIEKELFTFMKDVPKQLVRKLFEYPGAEPEFLQSHIENDEVIVPLTFKMKGQETLEVVLGVGNNRKCAKKAAAKLALRKLTEAKIPK